MPIPKPTSFCHSLFAPMRLAVLPVIAHTLAITTIHAATLSISATPLSVSSGAASTLTWSSSNATSCAASGAWSGAKAASGSQSVVAPNGLNTYALSCSGPGGGASNSVVIGAGTPPPALYTLNVTLSGSGTVTSNPSGISCGASCSASYPSGAVVTLSAIPAMGSTFSGWSGACSGSAACIVTLNANQAAVATFAAVSSRTIFYLSPGGNDSLNNGKSLASPWKTFAKAFAAMAAGDELILLDGIYSEAAGTGYISYLGSGSAQPPSGTSSSNATYIHALNPGNVTIQGALFIGRSTRKDSYIKLQGLSFEGGGSLYNTSYVTLKDCGFHGAFGIGTNDHDYGNDYDLIEDVWIWATGERIIAINYRAHRNVWRRVLVRGDGCGTASCSGSGNPNVGFTVYNSMDVSVQNVIVVDRILAAGDEPYSDFAVAQHAPGPDFGRNQWLGTISLKSPDSGYYMEPDLGGTVDPTITISNAVAWDASAAGFNVARAGTNNLLENLTAYGRGDDGIRVAPELTSGVLRNVISVNAGRYGVNSVYVPSFADVFNAVAMAGDYNQTTCSSGCYTSNPISDGATPSLKYLTRIEPGSFLKGKGSSGADIGANIVNRYGLDGARFGDAGFNTLGAAPLWPWPNEGRIKREMCAATARGFCSTGQRLGNLGSVTLTSYIWEYLGNALPGGIYP